MQILASSPEILFDRVYPYENRYLSYLLRLVNPAGELFIPSASWNMDTLISGDPNRIGAIPFTPESLDVIDFRRRLTRDTWKSLSESLLGYRGGKPAIYYAEKTHGYTHEYHSSIADLLADAGVIFKVIMLIRDPRDVVVSIRSFDERRQYYGFGRQNGQSEESWLGTLTENIATNMLEMQTWSERFNCILIRYEDLVTNPEQTVAEVSNFLGVPLDVSVPKVAGQVFERHATSPSPSASVGRWRVELSPQHARLIEDRLSDVMKTVGYLELS